jgi:hypothetical protein
MLFHSAGFLVRMGAVLRAQVEGLSGERESALYPTLQGQKDLTGKGRAGKLPRHLLTPEGWAI